MKKQKTVLFTACGFFPEHLYGSVFTQAAALYDDIKERHPGWVVVTDFPTYGLLEDWGADQCVGAPFSQKHDDPQDYLLSISLNYDILYVFYTPESRLHLNLIQTLSDFCIMGEVPFYLISC